MRRRTYLAVLLVNLLAMAVGALNSFEAPRFGVLDAVFAVPFVTGLAWVRTRYAPLVRAAGAVRILLSTLEAVALLYLSWRAVMSLNFSVQIFARPLQDDALLAFDHALGFDYVAMMGGLREHTHLMSVLQGVYELLTKFVIDLTLVGLLVHREERIADRYITACLVACVIAFAVCAVFPATGPVVLLDAETAALATGATPVELLHALRAGSVHEMVAAVGLVSFPSMHVGLAVVSIGIFARVRWLLAVVLPVGAGLCVTALTHGGHYLVDCLAGAAVGIVGVWIGNAIHDAAPWTLAELGRIFARRPAPGGIALAERRSA